MDAKPAGASGAVGYVRLAHLSPDTPDVDVYLGTVGSSGKPKVFPGVGYGVVSSYLTVPTGTYAVAMRGAGAPASSAPVLTTTVTVSAGQAYTVAGVGHHADLGLRVIDDDLSPPPGGKAKVRIVQASVHAPVLDASIAGSGSGTGEFARDVAFATTTTYYPVTPGRWTLRVNGTNNGPASTLSVHLRPGDVYSLLVLDAKSGGLTAQLRVDAAEQGRVPSGGVPTGAGGTQTGSLTPLLLGAGLLVLLLGVGGYAGYRTRRVPPR
ncbi:MAG TPA: DUF4397 domain-containing protein [Rugosimonospora sp.]|nr:DUF4397 domain-containing protein [Rugosimonospora sp.]